MTLILMFPGQSSRYPGMLDKLVSLDQSNEQVLEQASDLLGRDLKAHYRQSDAEAFACNRDVQVGVFLANHMFLQILENRGVRAVASLGLSLGEWNHLVHIDALSFEQALAAVEVRGDAYDAGPRGIMASVFPLPLEELEEVVQRVKDLGVIEVANLNSPRQNVLSGQAAAVDKAVSILEDEYFVQPVIIERQVPMHSSLFEPVSVAFREYLQGLDFQTPVLPYMPNRLARPVTEPDFVELLSSHVCAPVRWRDSIDFLVQQWPDACFLEVGPKAVLTNLIDRKWYRHIDKAGMDSADNTAEHLSRLFDHVGTRVERLAHGA